MIRKLLLLLFLFIVAAVLFFAARHRDLPPSSPKNISQLSVTTSFYPLADFASQVGGDKISVHNLTPAGSEPHDFEPSPQDLVALQNSKVFIYNGAGLEIWLDKLSDDVKQKEVMVEATKDISLLSSSEEEAETPKDPHVWLDPVLASQEVENIKNGLIVADPANQQTYQQNATHFQNQLADLDSGFRTGLANCQSRDIVTSHNAFQYLGKRYGLNILSISGLSPDEEPTPRKLAEVTQFVKKHNVKYIFFESLVSPKLSDTIAQETGAKTIAFNPLEGLTEEEVAAGKNYLSVQKENLKALQTALECK
jgi:zinc transport system substrate-binding protein